MCDNMDKKEIKEVIDFRNANFPHVLIEISGNITLGNIASYASLGADAISSGALIHRARFIDLSMKIR